MQNIELGTFWTKAQGDFYAHSALDIRKTKSQYFTPPFIAKAMARLLEEFAPTSVLDPAIGHGIFAGMVAELSSVRLIKGLDIDKHLTEFSKKNLEKIGVNAEIMESDFLRFETNEKFDAIICNPPYSIYKTNPVSQDILEKYSEIVGEKLAPTTNIYNIFYLKSIQLLKESGVALFIIPSEFFGTDYGVALKKYFIKSKCLKSVYFFDHSVSLFEDAITSSCICVFTNEINENIQLGTATVENNGVNFEVVRNLQVEDLNPSDKWYNFIESELSEEGIALGTFAKISRGIATGDNDFFIFSKSKILESKIPLKYFRPIITKSSQVQSERFTKEDFDRLVENDEKVFLLDVDLQSVSENSFLGEYIKRGELEGVGLKYLPSKRTPWFRAEKEKIPDFFVGTFSRSEVKFIKNEAGVSHLTCFHGGYLRDFKKGKYLTSEIVDFFNSSVGQSSLNRHMRKLGSGLSKLEPKDVEKAKMILSH